MLEGSSTDIAMCTCFQVFPRLLLNKLKNSVEMVIMTHAYFIGQKYYWPRIIWKIMLFFLEEKNEVLSSLPPVA